MTEQNWLLERIETVKKEFSTWSWSPWKQRTMQHAVEVSNGSSTSLRMFPPVANAVDDVDRTNQKNERGEIDRSQLMSRNIITHCWERRNNRMFLYPIPLDQ